MIDYNFQSTDKDFNFIALLFKPSLLSTVDNKYIYDQVDDLFVKRKAHINTFMYLRLRGGCRVFKHFFEKGGKL